MPTARTKSYYKHPNPKPAIPTHQVVMAMYYTTVTLGDNSPAFPVLAICSVSENPNFFVDEL